MTQEAVTIENRITRYIGKLRSYAMEGHENRAALAALRSGLQGRPGGAAAQHPYVMPHLADAPHKSDRWFYLIGALFAWHPAQAANQSLGAAFRRLREKEGASDSIETRFAALLASDERDLHLHLRQAVGLLRSKDVAVDWRTLLRDLAVYPGWNDPDRQLQMRWARDYYRGPRSNSDIENNRI